RTQADGRQRRRHGGSPASPRARGRAGRERLAGASIPETGGGLLCQRRLRPGSRTAAVDRGGGGPRVQTSADRVPVALGAYLERARRIRRGPAPRGGGA